MTSQHKRVITSLSRSLSLSLSLFPARIEKKLEPGGFEEEKERERERARAFENRKGSTPRRIFARSRRRALLNNSLCLSVSVSLSLSPPAVVKI